VPSPVRSSNARQFADRESASGWSSASALHYACPPHYVIPNPFAEGGRQRDLTSAARSSAVSGSQVDPAVTKAMWVGHSCPTLLILRFRLEQRFSAAFTATLSSRAPRDLSPRKITDTSQFWRRREPPRTGKGTAFSRPKKARTTNPREMI
jgi:hypothetical protein